MCFNRFLTAMEWSKNLTEEECTIKFNELKLKSICCWLYRRLKTCFSSFFLFCFALELLYKANQGRVEAFSETHCRRPETWDEGRRKRRQQPHIEIITWNDFGPDQLSGNFERFTAWLSKTLIGYWTGRIHEYINSLYDEPYKWRDLFCIRVNGF